MPLGRNAGKRMSTHELNESVSAPRRSMFDQETKILRVSLTRGQPSRHQDGTHSKKLSSMVPASAAMEILGCHRLLRNFREDRTLREPSTSSKNEPRSKRRACSAPGTNDGGWTRYDADADANWSGCVLFVSFASSYPLVNSQAAR